MTLLTPFLFAASLIAAGAAGPRLLRNAAPGLMRVPRLAITLVVVSLVSWYLSIMAFFLLLAWMITGPSLLPTPIADVCQRCLDAANPLGNAAVITTHIPVIALVAVPGFAILAQVGVGLRRLSRRRQATERFARRLRDTTRPTQIGKHQVHLVDDRRLLAFSLSRRHGGVFISTGLVASLRPEEIQAVLEHEMAHIRQRHHQIMTVAESLSWPMRWIPFISALGEALPHYLEIAADAAARRRTGTEELANALLRLGRPEPSQYRDSASDALLHAAGPSRISHLVAPTAVRPAVLPMIALALQLFAFAVATTLVHGPYLYVGLTGC